MDINKNSYDIIANDWATDRNEYSFVTKPVVDFAERVTPNGRILDIGCGSGSPNAKYLSDKGFTIKGIDVSEKLLEKAIALNLPKSDFELADFFEFDTEEKFDGIIAFNSFFHFPKDRQSEIYSRISKWLNPGGYLLFTHGNEDGEITGEMYGEKFYYSSLSLANVKNLLSEAGFEIEQCLLDYKERDVDMQLVILAGKNE